MISTANYVARKWGVRSAMPGFIAKELCPDLVIVHSDFSKYHEAAAKFRNVFASFDPDFVSYSLDEACLYMTPYLRHVR